MRLVLKGPSFATLGCASPALDLGSVGDKWASLAFSSVIILILTQILIAFQRIRRCMTVSPEPAWVARRCPSVLRTRTPTVCEATPARTHIASERRDL